MLNSLQSYINEQNHSINYSRNTCKSKHATFEALPGERPAAPQPAGLTVTLRPYQLQSLQFMIDAEQGEGGFRRLLWHHMTTPDGSHKYWWSPLFDRASLDVPAMPWGGFLGECVCL